MKKLLLIGGAIVLAVVLVPLLFPTTGPDATQPASDDAGARTSTIDCQAAAPETKFAVELRPKTASTPAALDVTFAPGNRPSSADAERILRACLDAALAARGRDADILATAWHSPTGRDADEDQIPLSDGSTNLVFESGKVMTWKEREGTSTQRTQASGYFTEYEEQNVLVRPGEKFAHVTVVFAKQPDEQTIYRTLMTELTNAVRNQSRKWPTTAFAETGSAANPASRTQIKGAAGRFISVEYDPKTGTVTNERDERIGAIR